MAAVADESAKAFQARHEKAADRYAKRTIRRSIVVTSVTFLAALATAGSPSSEKEVLGGRPKEWGRMIRREPTQAADAETLAETSVESTGTGEDGRPPHWGAVMRREEAASAATIASISADSSNAVKRKVPAQWGSMMRREERPGVVAEGPAEGEAEEDRFSAARRERPNPAAGGVGANGVPSPAGGHEGRPTSWGSMMRREGAATPPAGERGTAMSIIAACQDMLGDWFAGSGSGRMLCFLIACVGFGLQVKDMLFSAVKASMRVEAGIGKKQ